MDNFFWLVAAGGIVISLISVFSSPLSGARTLQRKFADLGDLRGKTRAEIISAVGPPNSVTAMADGALVQWLTPGYHVALLFDDADVCLGVSHESGF